MFAVAEWLQERGWLAALTRAPKGMHAMLSLFHEPVREEFLTQLAEAVADVRSRGAGGSGLEAAY